MRMKVAMLAFAGMAALLVSHTTVDAQVKDGDFSTKWNTWKTTQKGDWVEYMLSGGIRVRVEATDVKGESITYVRTTFDAEGKQTGSNELTRKWEAIPPQVRLPHRVEVTWRDDEATVGDVKVKCRVASWTIEGIETSTNEAWYSVEVPCGGVVKQTMNGKNSVWLHGFKSAAKAAGGEAAPEPEVKTSMPRFFAKVGNLAVYKITVPNRPEMYQRRVVTDVKETTAKYEHVTCDAKGVALEGQEPKTADESLENWQKTYKDPTEKGVKIKVTAGEYTCDVYESTAAGGQNKTWVSDGVIVKLESKRGEALLVLELVKLELK